MMFKILVIMMIFTIDISTVVESDTNNKKASRHDSQILRAAPQYPRKALAAMIEGHVTLGFNVSKNGVAVNPAVIEAEPGDVFVEQALKTLSYYRFGPFYINQGSEKQHLETIYFELSKGAADIDITKLDISLISLIDNLPDIDIPVVLSQGLEIIGEQSFGRSEYFSSVLFFEDLKNNKVQHVIWQEGDIDEKKKNQLKKKADIISKALETQKTITPGYFRQFHEVNLSEDHPPVFLSDLDVEGYLPFEILELNLELIVDSEGRAKIHRVLESDEVSKQLLQSIVNGMFFLPGFSDGLVSTNKIQMKFRVGILDKYVLRALAIRRLKVPLISDSWVEVGVLRDSKGNIMDKKILNKKASLTDEKIWLKVNDLIKEKPSKTTHSIEFIELK